MLLPPLPRVAVFTVAHNEAVILPFFARHYSWAEKIVVFDDESTDETREVLEAFPNVDVRYVNGGGVLDNGFLMRVKNHCWKECRRKQFGWVIVVDSDEFVCSLDVNRVLNEAASEGVTLIRPATAFNMVSDRIPDPSAELSHAVRRGVPNARYAKPCIFAPDRITEINLGPGCHEAAPVGEIRLKTDERLIMLHYPYLSEDFHVLRGRVRRARRSNADVARGWGIHHIVTDEENRLEHARALRDAITVIEETSLP